jgi:hypothetical protein
LERDPELVRWDVIEQFVSRDAARADYGVVLKDDLALDRAATDALREKLRASRTTNGAAPHVVADGGASATHTDLTVFATGIN